MLYRFQEGQASLRHLIQLGELLEAALGCSVDLVPRDFLNADFRAYVLDEVELIFTSEPATSV